MTPAPKFRLPWRFLVEFAMDGRTPNRALTDEAVVAFGKVMARATPSAIELGAGGDYYKAMLAGIMEVRTSNILEGQDLVLDMTKIALPDASVDGYISVFALEHLFDPAATFVETFRTLKDGASYLLVAPFLYFYHAAPDDFFRFTHSALQRLSEQHGFEVVTHAPIGDRALMFAEFLHEKTVLGSTHGAIMRFLMRMLALPFVAVSIARGRSDQRFAMGHIFLLRRLKRGESRPVGIDA